MKVLVERMLHRVRDVDNDIKALRSELPKIAQLANQQIASVIKYLNNEASMSNLKLIPPERSDIMISLDRHYSPNLTIAAVNESSQVEQLIERLSRISDCSKNISTDDKYS